MTYKPKRLEARVKQINDDGSVRYRLTSKKVDRHGEVVISDGVNLDNYKENPIVLFGHGWSSEQGNVPIGKIKPDSFKVTSTYVDADVIFDEEGKDPFAEMIGDKVRNGFLNAGSIGFRPTVLGNEPVMPKQTGVTILEWELFEFSIVPIPSNTDSLAKREFAEFKQECKSLNPDLDDSVFTPPIKFESIDSTTGLPITIKDIETVIEKAGKVLSSKNRKLVKGVADNMRGLLSELDILLEATEPKPKDDTEGVDKGADTDTVKKEKINAIIGEIRISLENSMLQNELNELK